MRKSYTQITVKLNELKGIPFQVSQLCVCSLLKKGLYLKGCIRSPWGKILSFKNRPLSRRGSVRENKQEVIKVVSLVENGGQSTKFIMFSSIIVNG